MTNFKMIKIILISLLIKIILYKLLIIKILKDPHLISYNHNNLLNNKFKIKIKIWKINNNNNKNMSHLNSLWRNFIII
jgi:hypothetical protein